MSTVTDKKKKSIRNRQILLLFTIGILSFFIGWQTAGIKKQNNTIVKVFANDLKDANPREERINLALSALKNQGIDLKLSKNDESKDPKNLKQKEEKESCLFIASRKSHKYHTADCKYGKKIKPNNKVCFKSMEEAKNKGFIPAKGCLGRQSD